MLKSITLPGSKSISARLLIIRHLADQSVEIKGISISEDTEILIEVLKQIKHTSEINIGASGANLRFILPVLCMQNQSYRVIGRDRIYERTIKPLVESCIALGADIQYLNNSGFAPIQISPSILKSATLSINAAESSQFASALLMIAPLLSKGLSLTLSENIVSQPYLELTIKLLLKFGIDIQLINNKIHINNGTYNIPDHLWVEPDWSGAAYWFFWVSIHANTELQLQGLSDKDLQGDKVLMNIYQNLNVSVTKTAAGIVLKNTSFKPQEIIRLSLKDYPDLFPSLACNLAFMNQKCIISDIKHIRIKESDRVAAMETILTKLGAKISVTHNEFIIEEGIKWSGKETSEVLSSYQDHRIAMTLGILRTKFNNLKIDNEACVSKSYPAFWNDLEYVMA